MSVPDYVPGMAMSAVALIAGLIATYVSLQNRALLAEVRKELARLKARLIEQFSEKFVRTGECALRGEVVNEKVRALIGAAQRAEPPPSRLRLPGTSARRRLIVVEAAATTTRPVCR